MASLLALLLSTNVVNSVQITGWVYADNWFELYFNGEKVATDTLYFYPHNAIYIDFTAPDDGLYSFAFWAQDYANDTTGLEPRITPDNGFGGWCVGDGGIRMVLSDGTVTSSDWKCEVVMEGPVETACQTECLANNLSPSMCTVTYNDYADCWYETECSAADSWSSATEYTQDDIGWGRAPNKDPETFDYTYPNVCSGLDATSTEDIYVEEGCVPADKDWGTSVPIWTGDLNYDNRIVCRYSYCVDGSTDCLPSSGDPTSSPSASPSSPTSPTTQTPSTSPTSLTSSPTEIDPADGNSGANGKLFGFVTLVITFMAVMF